MRYLIDQTSSLCIWHRRLLQLSKSSLCIWQALCTCPYHLMAGLAKVMMKYTRYTSQHHWDAHSLSKVLYLMACQQLAKLCLGCCQWLVISFVVCSKLNVIPIRSYYALQQACSRSLFRTPPPMSKNVVDWSARSGHGFWTVLTLVMDFNWWWRMLCLAQKHIQRSEDLQR